ncbi:hypothetical protein SAMN02927900_02488 [Rhizobium mongolense subsp. loessense]|uniref:Uncharacterized protein n=1 Tax=Rhizobium mongolense subsp. loessense TaxID=158890 RepID=A0A1G4RF51_9HYPH|nr:hypothetical protein [Rhizobium mongolense]SCW54809.1 hypothetical protein SAMN02927900_02488 [Rhizobium mongolense subsp. loessense]
MLIKFFRNGQGGGSGPVDYLVERDVVAYDQNRNAIRDERGDVILFAREPLPEVLRGDADRMRALIDALSPSRRRTRRTLPSNGMSWTPSRTLPLPGSKPTSAICFGCATRTRDASNCIS